MAVNVSWEEAQRAVIGSLLIDPEHVVGIVFRTAKAEHFDGVWQRVFTSARELWLARQPIDAVTVLAASGEDCAAKLREAMTVTPTAANVEAYLDICRSSARLTQIQRTALSIIDSRSEDEAAALLGELNRTLSQPDDVEDLSWSECVSHYLDRMADKTPVKRFCFGIEQLDKFLHVGAGKFVILAADSSVGKTALALQFAYHMARDGNKVGFFSLETDGDTLTDRLMAQAADIPLPRSIAKALGRGDFAAAMAEGEGSAGVPLRLIRNATTVERIRGKCIHRDFDVIFIDYVQLLDAPGNERWSIVTNISMELHRLAQELGVTVIGLSQITPPDKNSKRSPGKDDLRESRQLKHDADVIMMMSISSEGSGEFRELNIVKNKDGPLRRMLLEFEPERMRFKYREPPKQGVSNELYKAGKAAKAARRQEAYRQATFYDVAEDEEVPF